MLQTPNPPPPNVHAATTTTATVNARAITTSPGDTPVAEISLKLIGMTIPNVPGGNRGGSGMTQTTSANANTQKRLGQFSQLTPFVKLRL
jgi:hypothetical protein